MRRALALMASLTLVSGAFAEGGVIPMPGGGELKTFPYDPNSNTKILCLPGSPTNIQLAENEEVVALALGDSVQWKVEQQANHIFIKPTRPDIFTAGTLVTSLRTYQLEFRASPQGGRWYQKVSWEYPDILIFKDKRTAGSANPSSMIALSPQQDSRNRVGPQSDSAKTESPRPFYGADHVDIGTPVDNLSFDYTIEGDAPFRPTQIFDDGRMTWFKVKSNVQELPALFVQGDEGVFELVNYVSKPGHFIVQRLFTTAVLKLGTQEVRIQNKAMTRGDGGFWSSSRW